MKKKAKEREKKKLIEILHLCTAVIMISLNEQIIRYRHNLARPSLLGWKSSTPSRADNNNNHDEKAPVGLQKDHSSC